MFASSRIHAQGAGFTYQGSLEDGSAAVDTDVDFYVRRPRQLARTREYSSSSPADSRRVNA